MKLLVTGGLGFIGSNFILNTLEENSYIQIVNVDAELYGSHKDNVSKFINNEKYEFVKGNICNKNLMQKLIAKSDAVINFAAESFVDRSISNASNTLESNVTGVMTILEIIKNENKRLVHVSTDEVFGSLENTSAIENSKLNPSSPYAATKAAAELIINSFITTYDCDCVITRCTNNYGPRQFPEKLIPKTIILANNDKKIPVYGTGKNIRDWLFVNDHCNAIFQVLNKGKKGESYNISAKNEIDNLAIVKKILSIMGKSLDLVEYVEDRPGHDFRYSMDSTKIRNELDWRPIINFDEGIEQTIDWYQENKSWWKSLETIVNNKTPWKK